MRSVLYAFRGSATRSGFRPSASGTHSAACRRRLRCAQRHVASAARRSDRAGARVTIEHDRVQVLLLGADIRCESARQQECLMTPRTHPRRPTPRARANETRVMAAPVTVCARTDALVRAMRRYRVCDARSLSLSGSDLLVRDAAVTIREQVVLFDNDSLVTRPSTRGRQPAVHGRSELGLPVRDGCAAALRLRLQRQYRFV